MAAFGSFPGVKSCGELPMDVGTCSHSLPISTVKARFWCGSCSWCPTGFVPSPQPQSLGLALGGARWGQFCHVPSGGLSGAGKMLVSTVGGCLQPWLDGAPDSLAPNTQPLPARAGETRCAWCTGGAANVLAANRAWLRTHMWGTHRSSVGQEIQPCRALWEWGQPCHWSGDTSWER